MADVKISALPAQSPVAGTAVLPLVQSSATKKATVVDVVKGGGAVLKDGTVAMTAPLDMGGQRVINAADAVASTGLTTLQQVVAIVGTVAVAAGNGITDTAHTFSVHAADSTLVVGAPGVKRAPITGDVLIPDGSNVAAIAVGAVTTTKILDGNVTDAKLASSFVKANGTVPMAADFNLNSHKAVGMSPGTVGTDGVNKNQLDAVGAAAAQPFKATYYANPSFSGTSTGSASNPFTTIAAAFAAAAAAGYTEFVVKLPPGTTVTENVVFPSSGGNIEITSELSFSASTAGTILTGSVTMNATTGTLRAKITNIILNGNITGAAATGFSIAYQATCVRQNGSITLTSSGGICVGIFRGLGAPDANKYCGSNTQLVSVAGQFKADNWVFEGGITEAHDLTTPYPGSQFQSCWFGSVSGSPIAIGLNGASLNAAFYDCLFVGPTTFTASNANYVVYLDGPSRTSLNNSVAGSTFVNCLPNSFSGSTSVSRAVTATIGSTVFGGVSMPGLYEATALLDITSGSGSVVVNVIYTDRGGTLRTEAILSGTIAAGKLRSTALPYWHNGATAIAYSVTVTGTISAWLDMSTNLRS